MRCGLKDFKERYTDAIVMTTKKYSSGAIFCDIDGTLLSICGLDKWDPYKIYDSEEPAESVGYIHPLPGVKEKLIEWHVKGYRIILTTARPESLREVTVQTLHKFGIIYNDLIMDLPQGPRVVINDIDPDIPDMSKALAFNVERNKGISDIDLP